MLLYIRVFPAVTNEPKAIILTRAAKLVPSEAWYGAKREMRGRAVRMPHERPGVVRWARADNELE